MYFKYGCGLLGHETKKSAVSQEWIDDSDIGSILVVMQQFLVRSPLILLCILDFQMPKIHCSSTSFLNFW